jgi:5-methylcytosine-specific restriction endonuclease McrA
MYNVHRFGKDNPNWQGGIGKEPYSSEFTEELKESIRKRDNYECQNCGMTEEEHLIVIGYSLCVHHIDYNKHNCKEDNLITLCNGCNVRANYNRKYWQSYYTDKINAC